MGTNLNTLDRIEKSRDEIWERMRFNTSLRALAPALL